MKNKITFAEELLQFAKTVDILDEKLFLNIKEIINAYAFERWGVKYVKIMNLKFDLDGNRILEKFFLQEYSKGSTQHEMVNIDTSKGQMAYVIKHKQPVWIMAKDKKSYLNEAEAYVDCWSGLENIPEYQTIVSNAKIKTSIIVPFYELEKECRYLRGVANYEIPETLEFNKECRDEILTLTDTISELLNLYNVRERQEHNTNYAINRLAIKLEIFNALLRKNKIFIASPLNGEKDVKKIILKVLAEVFPDIELVDWEANSETGSISEKMFDDINSSRYGICYFSEWSKEKNKYIDNSNVMFEAGLMHAKFRTFSDEIPLWIPIREKESFDFPFNVQGFNTLIVPRNDKGILEKEVFSRMLKSFMQTITQRAKEDKF
ncbi:MAG: Unknown protein [uncultured Sulfurovum sp.]|uniref:TIR domain-containing protein n=1 Tax=uncultured Sulfurovum sp. TaxID=269237 RepID=A0A6S6TBH7_9BACT|nr:MAG: Unknown protein [uncultured Sulfurovum sp.]